MTETPPETPIPDEDAPTELAADADGVEKDRLTGVSFYDTALERYVGDKYPNKGAARRENRDLASDDRYVLRRV